MRSGCAAPLLVVALALGAATPAAAQGIPVAPPAPLAPDAAALAALPSAPSALPGLAPRGRCPAGVAPTGFGALVPDPDAVPGAEARGVTVAVVDSGVAAHPRLGGGVVDGGDFVAGRSGTADCDGHGTAVAGVVAATPGPDDGVGGVAPGAAILAVRADSAWSSTVDASGAGDEATLARGVRAAATHPGVAVITLAVAACRPAATLIGGADPALGALRAAVHDAAARGVVVVAAAGNAGPGCPANDPARTSTQVTTVPSPGWFDDDVVTVGALDDAGRPDPDSLAGPWVDLAAPGEVPAALDPRSAGLTSVLTLPGSAPAPLSGTSFAAARVAGAVAVLRARFPGMPAGAVVARLVGTSAPVAGAAPGRDPVVGAGALDLGAALAGVRPPAAPPPAAPSEHGDPLPWVAAGAVLVVLAVAALALARRRSAR